MAAEPNAIKSRCKIHKFVNLQREFQNLQRDFLLPAKMQEKIQNLQRDFKVFFYGFWIDFFSKNAETSVATEWQQTPKNQNFIKKIIFFFKKTPKHRWLPSQMNQEKLQNSLKKQLQNMTLQRGPQGPFSNQI